MVKTILSVFTLKTSMNKILLISAFYFYPKNFSTLKRGLPFASI